MVEESGPGGLRLTFAEAADRVSSLASSIAAHARPGERVIIATSNGYDQFLTCLAASRAGTVPVPLNPQMRPEEITHVVNDSEATLVVRDTAALAAASPASPASDKAGASNEPGTRAAAPEDVAAIFYTSGATGVPKGALLTHRGLVGQVAAAAMWPSRVHRDEAVVALPVAHIMGFSVLLALALAGVPIYFLPRFAANSVLDAIERRRSTMFIGVPAMYRLLEEGGAADRDLRSVRVWASGADVMPPGLARRFQRMGATVTVPLVHTSLGDASFVEGYGLVETAGVVATKLAPPGLAVPLPLFTGVLGFPLPGYRFRVVGPDGRQVGFGQVGELEVRGPGVLAGYHGDEVTTSAVRSPEGWLRTGDLVRRGLFGTLSFVGRAKDVIKSGGYSIYAVEVERAMEAHPDVVEAAAVGVPDRRLGQHCAVAVRVRAGAKVTEDQLVGWAAECLAPYKAPRTVRIVAEFPRTGTDKVAKPRLLPLFAA